MRRRSRRRVKIALVLAVLAVLLVVNLVVVFRISPSRRSYRYYQDGLTAFEAKRYSVAEIAFRNYLDIVPDRAEARYMLGMCLKWQGREEDAERELRQAIRLQPGLDVAHVALSDHLLRRGRYGEARRQALLAIETSPAPPAAYVVLSEIEFEIGDLRAAIDALKRALEKQPAMTEAQLMLGDLYVALEMRSEVDVASELAQRCYREAARQAQRNLSREPWDSRSRVWLTRALAGQGEYEEAIPHVTAVIGEEPFEPEHRHLLAALVLKTGDARGAARVLREAMSEAPSARIALERSRILAEELGDPEGAREVLDRAVEKFPDEVSLWITCVARRVDEGRFDAAERTLSEALERFPGSSLVLEARGDLCRERGEDDPALDAWRRAIEVWPENLNARRKLLEILGPRAVAAVAAEEDAADLVEEVERHIAFFLDPVSGLSTSDLEARSLKARLEFARGEYVEAAELMGGNLRLANGSYEELRLLGLAHLRSAALFEASEALLRALRHPDCPHSTIDYELAFNAAHYARRTSFELAIASEAAARWPENAEWRLRHAESLLDAGRGRDALEECARAREILDPARTRDVRAHLLAQRILLALGESASAREELDSAMLLRRDPETRAALYSFFALTGEERLAEEGFRTLVEEHPGDPVAKLRYGDFLVRRGRSMEALDQYERAVEASPDSRDALYRLAELRIASAATDAAAIDAAEEAVRRIRSLSPDDPFFLYFRGKLQLLRGEAGAARESLARYVEESPGDAAGCYYLAVAERRGGDPERARDLFQAALRIEPGMVEAKLELAALFFTEGLQARNRGDAVAARTAFEKVSRIDPSELSTRGLLAESLAVLGEFDQAAGEAEIVLEGRPDDLGALFISGISLAATGDFEGAERRFRRLVELRPDGYRSHLYLGKLLAETGRYEEARKRLLEAYALEPDSDEVLRALAGVHVARGKPEDALLLVTAEQERRPTSAFIQHLLGDLHRDAGRYREAVKAYLQAFSLSAEDDLALLLAASMLADEGEAERAIAILLEGARRAVTPADLHTLRGRMLVARGDAAEAETAFREALVADSGHAGACRELGEICVARARMEEGRRLLEAAVEKGLVDPSVHFRLGHLATLERRWEDAESSFRRVVELEPENAAALNNLALVIAESPKRLAEALEFARRAREVAPEDSSVAGTLGWVLGRMDSFDEAIPLLVSAARALPDDAETQYHAGLVCFRAHLWEEAPGYLERALDLDPDRSEAAEARAALAKMR